MSLVDWRRWLDVGSADGRQGAVALEVTDAGQLVLDVTEPDGGGVRVYLNYSDAGMLLDWLREAVGVQLLLHGDGVAGAAVAGVQLARDTPTAARPLSDGSDSITPRG